MGKLSLLFVIFVVVNVVASEVPKYLQRKYRNNLEKVSPNPNPHGGVKTKTKTKTKTNYGPPSHNGVKFRGGCTSPPPTPQNAGILCSKYTGCKAECYPSYQFPNGATQLFITCENGQWIIEGGIWQFVPSCEPICLPPCQNRGICTAPNQCRCPENFSGPFCQFENKPCMSYPQLSMNARRSCSSKSCTVTCLQGHRFPDGSAIATMSCKDGFWIPDKEKWTSLPDCEPTCDPPCLNGGNCLSFGICQCPQEFRGPQCQYSVDNCDAKALQFNGGYNCSGDQNGLYCSLFCAPGMEFDTTPSSVYTCLYREAKFTPTPIPQCTLIQESNSRYFGNSEVTRHSFYDHSSKSNFSSFDLKTMKVNSFPEVEYIPPGHRWDYDYNGGQNHYSGEKLEYITIPPYEPPQVEIIQQKLPEPGICLTWQGTHYKTFDGRIYSFQSNCAHILVRDAVDNTFSVIVQNSPKCSNDPTNCYKIITIFFDKKKYTLEISDEGFPVFSTPKKRLPIPAQLPGVRVEMSAHYIIMSLDTVGSKIKWDGRQLVQVEVQESLWNRTAGLCGNIDGETSNDLLRKDGQRPQTIVNFASNWQVDNLESVCDDPPREEHPCLTSTKSAEAKNFCEKIINDPRFTPCHTTIDISLILDACRWDYCSSRNSDPSLSACETLNVYIRACTFKGVKNLSTWRDEKTCPMQCTGGKIYKPCGPPSGQPVCGASTEQSDEDQGTCVEGCYCPEGTVLHDNQCITRDKCPCKLRTKSFPPGAQVPKECNTCTCSEGRWICTQVSCGSRCAAIGDPHYVTFDGKKFDFMGQCSYYLVKTETFSIEAENVACAGAISEAMNLPTSVSGGLPSCTKTVTVKIFGQVIKLKQNHGVVVNGMDVTKLPYQVGNVTIRSVSSIFQQVELPNGMVVWWDGVTRAYIDIPANFEEKTKGLCGTFNNNQKDDFITPEGDIEQAIIPFANKWKTNEKCNDVPDVLKSHPCSSNVQNQPTAEKHCRKIKSDLFSSCHWIVNPEPYYQDCLYDMCSCEFKISKCLCPTVGAYAEECARQGVKISWREIIRECGIHCPNGQKYQICGNSCTRTCFDIATRPDCKPQCVEGCNCPEGEALNDDGECIPIGECQCHYDGLQFHPGYREVRPASKGPELCTCINAFWSCRLATQDEQQKYPKASDLKSLCSASENMEFTTCEPAEPVTCKNMHNFNYFSADVCHPGCKCKENYVMDTTTKKCMKPSECPCHHGGKSYKENSIVQNDCNTCKCQNGKWTCTDRPCSAECSAWGDSHFKTFDGKHYDFQGQCDYVLAKGSLGSLNFDISLQNVPCGTLGTSCSKAITIRVKSDVILLTKDKSLPDFTTMKHITVRLKGLYVIAEAPDSGLVVLWDKGTRVYVKVDPRWKNKVQGLCGNYNDNEADDFQTPSGGLTEASPLIFGDSWKLQSYCPEALEVTSTCEDRPDRKVWALKQCGILKSSIFSPCHSEVPVDIYLEKCVFDACACDQGGDCECLCTALAAYAQECNTRGVPIKWRSQNLCPMQCDKRCSNYSPCISTCPTETCDNLLTESQISKTCNEDSCIEGCAPKPCPLDHIYLNSTLLECVPRNTCKPICMEKDGVTYYEGDLVEEDQCHSCHCSRGEKVCTGKPCTTEFPPTTPRYTTHQLEQIIKCETGWSEWINQDKGKKTEIFARKKNSDYEPLPSALILNNLKGGKCTPDKIVEIECRTVEKHLSPKKTTGLGTGVDVECSLERGLVCRSTTKSKKSCDDFEIRVFCECENKSTTIVPPTCDPSKPNKEHPTNCHLFYHCEPGMDGPKYVEKSCGLTMYYNPVTMVCDWPYTVEKIKPECKVTLTTEEPTVEETETDEISIVEPETPEQTEYEVKKPCPEGTEKDNCAIQCDQLCLYYSYAIKTSGFCKNGQKCEPGCVKLDQQKCPEGTFRSNNDTCVALKDCLCRSDDGKPVRPGTVYRESECRICQCVDNYYSCDESGCESGEKIETLLPVISHVTETEFLPPILSTVTPPKQCQEDHYIDLIQGDQSLPNVTFYASSVLGPAFAPQYAKFDSKVEGQSGGSWVPQYTNNQQYLKIDLGQQEPIYGVKIKGSPLYDEYVTSYKVSFSPDGNDNFYPVLNKDKLPQIFRGSIDATTPVQQIFDTPFEAKIVKIHPETWHTGIALRVELIGCGELQTTTPLYEFIPITIVTTAPPLMCDDPMGYNEGIMSDQQITVSSEVDRDHNKENLKLGSPKAWQPVINTPTEFIQFDFLGPRNITGIETKGGPKGWVTAYIVKYSQDGKIWNPIIDKKTKTEKTFLGNFDHETPQINHFDMPINANFLKLIPTKWSHNIQMRVEVHGCFEPYLSLPEEKSTLATLPECNYCPGVTTQQLEMNACRCKKDQWWDGENCIGRTECPCFVGHISYSVGTSYQKEDCSECLCKIGGVSHCNPKKCQPCEDGLRSTVTSTCKCTCQPCPEDTTLCPTSNICINTTLWCNGVQDCPDDEVSCPTTTITTTTSKEVNITQTTSNTLGETVTKKCPVVECPAGFRRQMKPSSKGRQYQSSMFSNLKNSRRKGTFNAVKTSKKFVKSAVKKRPPLPPPQIKKTECAEYICVSTRPPPKYIVSKQECPLARCPPGYNPVYEREDYLTNTCPEYTCEPVPLPDALCNVTGRTFNTFDETEYKYDICNHILARDLANDDWEVSLRKTCTAETCWRDLIIHHQDHLLVFHPNLTAEFDGFSYTVDQTKKIGSQITAFSISRLGNVLLFVSNRFGFWIIWDKESNVKLGVSRKLIGKVDGLCGVFNENPDDDKTKPDGTVARTTVEFGDSWTNTNQVNLCEPQVCPLHIQNKAWEICQAKERVLEPCNTVVNKDSFISRCIETTCDCLRAAGDNKTAEDECRCATLEDFVTECLSMEASTDLSDWRIQLNCPATCEAPLVYHDCYQRKCEPTCESLSNPEAACPKLPNVCFPGCYCPPGMVLSGDTCINPSNCRDCECNVLPHLQYVTYDENNFTINANCVYVMTRDVLEHKFQVLITNAPCDNNNEKICVGKVTVLYQGHKIHILNDPLRHRLKVIVDGQRIDDFGEITWAKIRETTSKHIKIHLTDIQVAISVYFPSLGVAVKVPSQKYSGKLEGLCGDCDTNPLNDFRTPSKKIVEDPNEFALSWLYDKLPGGQSKEQCENKKQTCEPLPKKDDPCSLLLDYKTFGQCLRILDPTLFMDWCWRDTCDNHPELACTAIEAYAKDCASAGLCINWRNNLCPPKTCPPDQIYNPCATRIQKTCQNIKDKIKDNSEVPVEGCFCPDGLVLLNDTCVAPKDCEVCDQEGHHPGDIWKKDKCTSCTCEGTSLKCETEHCSGSDKICEQGYKVVKIPSKEDECCDKYACVPEPTSGPTCETPQAISCGPGQTMKLSTKPNGCQHFICECKPLEECEPLNTEAPLEEGYVKTVDTSGCCPEIKITCKKELCPKPKQCEQYHTLKNETIPGKCCPLHTCEPPKEKCIYEFEYTSADEGGERLRTDMEKQKILKNGNETWQDGPCRLCKCSLTSIGNYQATCSQTDCSAIEISQDYLDYELVPEFVYDQCCPNVKRVACKFDNKIYKVGEKWTKEDDFCTVYQCVNVTSGVQKETNVIKCPKNCDLGFEYFEPKPENQQCCGSCRPVGCVVEGKVYKPSEIWVSEDFCTLYNCESVNGSMQVQSLKITCQKPSEEHLDNFVYKTEEIEGECCKNYTPTACKVDDKVYQIGESWPSSDGNKCKTITCVKNPKGEITKLESIETCRKECGKGYEYRPSNETCCGECVQVACVVDNTVRKTNETWTSADNCTTYSCMPLDDEFMIMSEQMSCPSLDDCPEENIYSDGCCKRCNMTIVSQKRCYAEAMPIHKTIGLIKAVRGSHGICTNKEAIKSFTECIGICHSATYFDTEKGSHENICSCCQATKYYSIQVELECEDGYKFEKTVAVPSKCNCEGCAVKNKSARKTYVKT